MASATQPELASATLSLEEYLHTAYHPDCDLVDGLLEERTMGETPHSLLQVEIAFWFRSHREEWKIRVLTELRTRVGAPRVRIPDLCVVPDDGTIHEKVRTTPPLLAIEILTPEDRMNRVMRRLDDLLDMGVGNLWVIDPAEHTAFTCSRGGLQLVSGDRIHLPGTLIYIDLPELFAALD